MRLDDSDEERAFRSELRAWLRTAVPAAPDGLPPQWTDGELRAWSAALHEAGYAGLTWPVEHGGRGLSPAYQAVFAEESALAEAPDQANVIGLNMVGPSIIAHGSEAQRAHHLPRILSGETTFCQGFSEPEAGSDLAALRTRATPVPGGYLLNGHKLWSSYAHLADHCLLLARTDPDAPRHRGLSCFLLDLRAPGVEVRPLRKLSGDDSFSEIVLRDVFTPADSVLGAPGDGWRVAMTTLAHERGTFGIALTARLAVQHARLRRTITAFGADRDPVVRREFAELHVELEGLRHTGYRALATLLRTGEPGPESTVVKLGWSRANQRLTALACRVAARADHPWYAHWTRERLRARTNTIEGGTSEVLLGVIAERVLGLPRSR
ncbi:acyl-CoA dehydrogenase family protein [Saccharothrix obliqua]|uniref:acyl-CoA dehydrogenase family protein n=1 Tax=Saccharothrix obliqua TaxID=2861747 RepID=UPI001C5EB434|nr:acyl-CoA dehydrogenase family protein [Saccharothrix obliqua]MBW4721843.1 acyl-CoA dehydrogenase family protein [Saccharothrix obliqua]